MQAVTATTAQGMFGVEAHVQKTGWKNSTASNSMEGAIFAGSTGESHRLEAIRINLLNDAPEGLSISYRAHVQKIGWQAWVDEGEMAGTEHQSKRVEAIQIAVSGEKAQDYVVLYRAHVQKYGWLDWVTAGSTETVGDPDTGTFAGTVHESKRVEAIEIAVLTKAQNDLLSVKQKAVEELNNTYNPADYTINEEVFNQYMEDAIKDIYAANSVSNVNSALTGAKEKLNGLANDEKCINYANGLKKTAISTMESTILNALDVNILGKKITYANQETIKAAVENAKTTITNAEAYNQTDINKVRDAELVKIYEATKTVVGELIDEIYNTGLTATKDTDLVLKEDDYNTAKEALEAKEYTATGVTADNLTEVLKVFQNGSNTGAYNKLGELSELRDELGKTLVNTDVKVGSDALKKGFGSKEQGKNVGTRTTETQYQDLVKSYLEGVIKALEGKTYTKMLSDVETAKAKVLSDIQDYIRTTLNKTTDGAGNSDKVLAPSTITGAKELQRLLNSSDLADLAKLIDEYESFCSKNY